MMPDLLGRQFDQYRLMDEIGRGGMGVVYRAWDERLDRPVAVKVLAPFLSWDPEFVERFRREAQLAGRLKHGNIVAIHNIGEVDGMHYIAMAYLPGKSLLQLIHDDGILSPARTARIVTQLAAALDEAHAQGLVHRDVKPANIIIGPGDHATLTDFGLVYSGQLSRLSGPGIVGTPEYMAPEQADESVPVTPATDQYGLGAVTFEMLTGRPPFRASTPMKVLMARASRPPPPLRQFNGAVPLAVESAVLRALSVDPRVRYASTGAFAEALAAGSGGAREDTPSATANDHSARPPREPRPVDLLLVGAAVMAALFVLGLIFVLNEGVDKPLNAANARATSNALKTRASGSTNSATSTAVAQMLGAAQAKQHALETAEAEVAMAEKATAAAATMVVVQSHVTATAVALAQLSDETAVALLPPRPTLQATATAVPVQDTSSAVIAVEPAPAALRTCAVSFRWLVNEQFAARSDINYRLLVCEMASDVNCTHPVIAKVESGLSTNFDPGKREEYEALGLSGRNGTYGWFVDAVGPSPLPEASARRSFEWSGDGCGEDAGNGGDEKGRPPSTPIPNEGGD